jgi:hypothetical protein
VQFIDAHQRYKLLARNCMPLFQHQIRL